MRGDGKERDENNPHDCLRTLRHRYDYEIVTKFQLCMQAGQRRSCKRSQTTTVHVCWRTGVNVLSHVDPARHGTHGMDVWRHASPL